MPKQHGRVLKTVALYAVQNKHNYITDNNCNLYNLSMI